MLEIWYYPQTQEVQVWTYDSISGWIKRAVFQQQYQVGDVLGARSLSDGSVFVYRNSSLIGTANIFSWPFFDRGGYIGLWMINAKGMYLDNFFGGNYQ